MNSDDLSIGETCGEDVEGVPVVGVVEGGDEDALVGDVEVRIARREALAVEDDGGRHGELDDLEGFALGVAPGAEAVEVLG